MPFSSLGSLTCLILVSSFSRNPVVFAQQKQRCDAGHYNNLVGNQYVCAACPEGYYQQNSNSYTDRCTAAQAGWYSDGTSGAKQQKPCGAGKYSKGATSYCTPCPAGTQCTSDTTTEPQLFSPGQYQPYSGSATAARCPNCPAGEFNNVRGATSCCQCCHGYYNNNTGQTNCQRCSDKPKTGGPIGSKSKDSCTATGLNLVPQTCLQDSNQKACPRTSADDPPTPTYRLARRKLTPKCAKGYKLCQTLHGRGGYDCVNIANDMESCGGCMDFSDSPDSGRDCTSIEGADGVSCIDGKCVVHSCIRGFLIAPGGRCVSVL